MLTYRSKLIQRAACLLVVLGLLSPFMVSGAQGAPSSEPQVIPSAFFDPYSVGWTSVRNMTSAQFSQYFDEMTRKGYFVLDIEVDEVDGVERVSAVWQKNVDGRGWAEHRNLTDSEFNAKWTELKDLGYRPTGWQRSLRRRLGLQQGGSGLGFPPQRERPAVFRPVRPLQ
jgi:hypothetical protein